MAFNRKFIDPYPFENIDKLALVKIVQKKTEEGWEMVKPIFPLERHYFEADGRTKWIALMTYKGRETG